jgi:DNA (cytosine-5)-methyltransferase 1
LPKNINRSVVEANIPDERHTNLSPQEPTHLSEPSDADELRQLTGWPWTPRELGSFFVVPKQSSEAHRKWRSRLVTFCCDRTDSDMEIVKAVLDRHVARLREITRILMMAGRFDAVRKEVGGNPRDLDPVVIERIKPLSEISKTLGISEEHVDQQYGLYPPDLQVPIFRALNYLSRRWCHADRSPDCSACPVAIFCEFFRSQINEETSRSDGPTVLDLYSGCGGLSFGFRSIGFRTVCAVDSDADAALTFRLNFPEVRGDDFICGDLTDDRVHEQIAAHLGSKKPDVIIGGPPCQGFSRAGSKARTALRSRSGFSGFRLEDDDRNYLFEELISLAEHFRPKVVLMENVPGMDSVRPNALSFMGLAREMLKTLGYNTNVWQLDAASYGVPQHRLRKFLVGSLGPVAPAFPEPEYKGETRSPVPFEDLLPTVTLHQAIGDLPPVEAGSGQEVAVAEFLIADDDPVLRHVARTKQFPLRTERSVIFNHRARWNNESDLALYALLREGEDAHDIVTRYGRVDLMKYRKDIFHDKYYRLRGDTACRTIVSHLGNDGNGYIHPNQTRSITRREGARVQTFPDDFVFCGSQQSQWRQIGNAVPPLLARSLALTIRRHMERFF